MNNIYIHKETLQTQTIPIPEDLDNWYSAEFDEERDYTGLVFDANSQDFVERQATIEEKIATLKHELQAAVLKMCQNNQFYSIESMRSHATNSQSLLFPIATKLNTWETAQNNHFISKLREIQAGTLDVDTVVFEDEFTSFVEVDW